MNKFLVTLSTGFLFAKKNDLIAQKNNLIRDPLTNGSESTKDSNGAQTMPQKVKSHAAAV